MISDHAILDSCWYNNYSKFWVLEWGFGGFFPSECSSYLRVATSDHNWHHNLYINTSGSSDFEYSFNKLFFPPISPRNSWWGMAGTAGIPEYASPAKSWQRFPICRYELCTKMCRRKRQLPTPALPPLLLKDILDCCKRAFWIEAEGHFGLL